jgi:hypothetical protein
MCVILALLYVFLVFPIVLLIMGLLVGPGPAKLAAIAITIAGVAGGASAIQQHDDRAIKSKPPSNDPYGYLKP